MATKWTGATCAQYFIDNEVGTSANYCIGYNGDISCSVPEDYAGYTSGCKDADKRGITFECSDTATNNWRIPEATQESLIKMMVDCIQRYPSLGGKAVYDPTDEARVVAAKNGTGSWDAVKGNVIVHRWTTLSGSTCPEWHMMQILPDIVAEVNRRLGASASDVNKNNGGSTVRTLHEEAQYMIDNNVNGQARKNQANADGFTPEGVQAEINKMLAKDKSVVATSIVANMPEVKYGSTGDIVKVLQKELARLGYYTGDIDGSAGNMTLAAIKAIQTNWKIVYGNMSVDGVFGKKCWTRLLLGK
jgi:hypothetical protein